MRSSSGCSVSGHRTCHGCNVTVPIWAAQMIADGWVTFSASAVRPGGEGHRAGLEVVGMLLRNPLLVDLLAVDAVGKALQMYGSVAQQRHHRVGDRQVVVDQLAFGAVRAELREVRPCPGW